MKVIIAGSRNITDPQIVGGTILDSTWLPDIEEIISGTARGVDTLGEAFAKEYNIPIKRFPAKWGRYGGNAGFIRNQEMGQYADALIAVWDGQSSGTRSMIDIMQRLNKPVHIHTVNNDKS